MSMPSASNAPRPSAAPKFIYDQPPPKNGSILDTARWQLECGFWPIPVTPHDDKGNSPGKRPLGGTGWGETRRDEAYIVSTIRRRPGMNLGTLLGHLGGLVDLDIDNPRFAEKPLSRMFPKGVPRTLGFKNADGRRHYLFRYDPRFAAYDATVIKGEFKKGKLIGNPNYLGLEIRMGAAPGGDDQCQSVIPPSMMSNAARRIWNDCEVILPAPDELFEDMDRHAVGKWSYSRDDVQSALSGHFIRLANAMGVKFTESAPSKGGWVECHAIGRDDNNPSAGVSEETGAYHDFAEGTTISFFDMAARLWPTDCPDWAAAVAYWGAEFGVRPSRFDGKQRQAEARGPASGRSVIPIRPTTEQKPSSETCLPEIVCGNEDPEEGLKTWTPLALESLGRANAASPRLFQMGGVLSRLKESTDGGTPSVVAICRDGLRGEMDRAACYAREVMTKHGRSNLYGPPPMEIVRDILALPKLDTTLFPVLSIVTETPQFTAEGELLLTPGYHAPSRTLYLPPPELDGLEVPKVPTEAEVDEARSLILDDLLVDIAFANQASRANAVALMLLPFVRQMIPGPTPNHHITASTEGVGKGLTAAAVTFPFLRRDLETNPQKESEAEWRKALTSFFMSGKSHFFIDNMYNPRGWDDIEQPVDSGTLASAWTSPVWADRLLGGNKHINLKIWSVFMTSANNLQWSKELRRRLLLIELIALIQDPSDRTGFKHPELMLWAKENQVALTRACLVLCQNWIAGGCKRGKYVMGSYEVYAPIMGGLLDACGIPGFLANRPKTVKNNPESNRWIAFVEAWHLRFGQSPTPTADLWDLVASRPGDAPAPLQDLFHDVIGDKSPASQKTRLGLALDKYAGRIWGDWRIGRSSVKAANKGTLWKLLPKDDPFDSDGDDDETDDDPPF